MSGGSFDYVYSRVEDAARQLRRYSSDESVEFKAFGEHLLKVAEALKDVEWYFSGDISKEAAVYSINKIVKTEDKLSCLISEGNEIIKELSKLLQEVKYGNGSVPGRDAKGGV